MRRITATAAALLAALTCLVVRAAQAQAATVTYPAVIHGVNLDGTESACKGLPWNDYQGKTFDGPTDSGSVTALQSWHINMVRVPINEDCWLGINGLPAPNTMLETCQCTTSRPLNFKQEPAGRTQH